MQALGLHIGAAYRPASGSHLDHSYRDSAAALLSDDGTAMAIAEERLDGIKNSPSFPARAIRFCLAERGATLSAMDAIVIDMSEDVFDRHILERRLHDPRLAASTAREWLAEAFDAAFDIDVVSKLRFCEHTAAHINYAAFGGPADDVLAVCFDGAGGSTSGMVAHVVGGDVRVLGRLSAEQSLAKIYRLANSVLGFDGRDVYESMALAPFGTAAALWPAIEPMHRLLPEGEFTLTSESEMLDVLERAGVLRRARRGAASFSREHRDFAAAAQLLLRRVIGHVVKHYRNVTGAKQLCLCGALAANTEINGRLMHSGLFDSVVVPRVADDAGNAVGAALAVVGSSRARRAARAAVRSGPRLDRGDLLSRLAAWAPFVTATELDESGSLAAQLIADGEVLGWVQGDLEFIAHSPGSRALIADPRTATSRSRMAQIIGVPEETLFCAVSVLHEVVLDCADLPASMQSLPSVDFNLQIRADMKQAFAAAMVPDGTAIVDAVKAEGMPRYHSLITAFRELTGVPGLVCAELTHPCAVKVGTLDEALAYFVKTPPLKYFVLENRLLSKSPAQEATAHLSRLVPRLAAGYRLTLQGSKTADRCFAIEASTLVEFSDALISISSRAFDLLAFGGSDSMAARCDRMQIVAPVATAVLEEILQLWRRGRIQLRPP